MDRRTVLPIYPDPPQNYTARWAADLVRALDQLNVVLRNPGEGRFTTATFTNLPTTDVGLEPGALFRQGNVVYIVTENLSYPGGVSATASLGSVTVTV
jgi:hypothetical protein